MRKDIVLSLGEKIRQIRNAKGISQENMARAINSNQPFIHRLEHGQVECSDEMLESIRRFLEIKNAPLFENELKIYRDRIWLWDDIISAHRIDEAKVMENELSSILSLPFEGDLTLMYLMMVTRLLLKASNVPAAEEKMNEGEALLDSANKEALFMYYRNKGVIYAIRGDIRDALKHYLQALDFAGNDIKPDASVFSNIGVLYMRLGKPSYAIEYLKRTNHEYSNDRHIIRANTNAMLATAYTLTGEYNKASKLFYASLAQAKSVNDISLIGMILSNMGIHSVKTGNYKECVRLCDQGLAYYTQGDKHQSKLVIYHNKGVNTVQCLLLFNKGLGLFKMKEYDKCHEIIKYGLALIDGDERFNISFTALGHLMALDNSKSIDYLEDVAIPFFKAGDGFDKYLALDICKEIEAHYKRKRVKTKALAFAAIQRDIYEGMLFNELELEE